MTVPLDRLYNFLDDLIDDNLIIYRWSPHGSKKLADLTKLKFKTLSELFTQPRMVCHDQEPLNYFLYSTDEILNALVEERLSIYPGWTETQFRNFYLNTQYYLNYLQELMGIASVYDHYLLLHSEKNSVRIDDYKKYGAIPVYYFCHALISRDWFRYAEIDPALSTKKIIKDFLIYNRAWAGSREYRIKFSELVVENNLHQVCHMNFSNMDHGISYTAHKFTNHNFKPARTDLENYFFKNTANSNYSADYDNKDYCSCGIEVVLETLFDDQRHHLTEKIFRPIACGQPFILAATPYSLDYLKSYGFKTFNNFIDESYDAVIDPLARLNKIVSLMKDIANLGDREKSQLYTNLNSVTMFNKQWVFSDDFSNVIINEYKTNMQKGLNKLKKVKGKNFFSAMERRKSNNVPTFIDSQIYKLIIELINS